MSVERHGGLPVRARALGPLERALLARLRRAGAEIAPESRFRSELRLRVVAAATASPRTAPPAARHRAPGRR